MSKNQIRTIQLIILFIIPSLLIMSIPFWAVGASIDAEWAYVVGSIFTLSAFILGFVEAVLAIVRRCSPIVPTIKFKHSKKSGTNNQTYSQEMPPLVKEFDDVVRWNFPKLPDDEFKLDDSLFNTLEKECKSGKPEVSTVQKILIEMEHFLGIKGISQSIIFIEKIDDNKAGFFMSNDYTLNEITIGYNDIYNVYNYLYILSHEISHVFQYYNNKQYIFSVKEYINNYRHCKYH